MVHRLQLCFHSVGALANTHGPYGCKIAGHSGAADDVLFDFFPKNAFFGFVVLILWDGDGFGHGGCSWCCGGKQGGKILRELVCFAGLLRKGFDCLRVLSLVALLVKTSEGVSVHPFCSPFEGIIACRRPWYVGGGSALVAAVVPFPVVPVVPVVPVSVSLSGG